MKPRRKQYRIVKKFSVKDFKLKYFIQEYVRKYYTCGLETYFADMWESQKEISKEEYRKFKSLRRTQDDFQRVLFLSCNTKERKILNETKER